MRSSFLLAIVALTLMHGSTSSGAASRAMSAASSFVITQPIDAPAKPASPAADVIPAAAPTIALLDHALNATPAVSITAIRDGVITVHMPSGEDRPFTKRDILAIVPLSWTRQGQMPPGEPQFLISHRRAVVSLCDGQAIVGVPDSDIKPAPDVLSWMHKGPDDATYKLELGDFAFKLDQVARVDFPPLPSDPASLTDQLASLHKVSADTLLLRNGDRLEGFMLGFQIAPDGQAQALAANIEVNKKPLVIPMPRIRAIILANPPARPSLSRVWLLDGTIVAVSAINKTDANMIELSLTTGALVKEQRITTEAIACILLDAAAVWPLANITPSAQGSSRRWTPPVVAATSEELLDLSDVLMPGAMWVRYAVPTGAKNFHASLVLPDDSRTLADFDVVFAAIDAAGKSQPLTTKHLSASATSAPVSFELPANTKELSIEIKPGVTGAVHTRLWLRHAAFLAARP